MNYAGCLMPLEADSAHVGAIGLALEPLAWWICQPSSSGVDLVVEVAGAPLVLVLTGGLSPDTSLTNLSLSGYV